MFLPSVMQYFNDLTPGRGADLRPGHRPARPAQEVARGAAAEEPQPGGQELLDAHRHQRRDPRPEPGRRPVRRQGRHGAAARQVLGELRAAVRRAAARPSWRCIRSSTPAGGFNVEALRQALATRAGSWKTILILNFPNNPTGYSITKAEADADRGRAARGGRGRPQPGRGDRRRLLRPVLRRGRVRRNRCSPGWPAATSGSWPSRSTARPRRSSSGASAPAC